MKTVDFFFLNSLLPTTFSAKLMPWIGTPGDGAPRGALGFVEGGVTATNQGVEASSFMAFEVFHKISHHMWRFRADIGV